MKYHRSYLILLLLLSNFILSPGQINESIRNASDDNQSKSESGNSGNNSGTTTNNDDTNYSDDDDDYSSSGDGCADIGACFSLVCPAMLSIIPASINYQKNLIERKEEIPRVTSIDVMLHAGINPNPYYVTLPRVRATWGLFSSDFRIFSNIEPVGNAVDTWRTYDWQFLQLNFLTLKPLTVRLGSGLMWEQYGGRSFNEHSAGVQAYLFKEKLMLWADGRLALDYKTNMLPRQELGGTGNFKFLNSLHLVAYGSAGLIWQRYYESIDIWSFLAGIHFSIQ